MGKGNTTKISLGGSLTRCFEDSESKHRISPALTRAAISNLLPKQTAQVHIFEADLRRTTSEGIKD